ncbi:MAG: hypothetical protein VW810_00155 [Pelagibacteraceae bacterium]
MKDSFFDTKQYRPDRVTPEQKLWRAVLGQIFDDAFGHTISNKAKYEKSHAREYLKYLHRDYAQVCEFAGYDPMYVHRKVKRKFTTEFLEVIDKHSLKVRYNKPKLATLFGARV